jgi:hypothetical protein
MATMDSNGKITILTAIIGASVAICGYVLTQAAGRRERRARAHAEALRVISDLQEIPFRVLRRPDSSPATRHELDLLIGETLSKARFHLQLLRLESPTAAAAYDDLWEQTRKHGRVFRRWAWCQEVMTTDKQMAAVPPFDYGNLAEFELCVAAMRADTRLLGGLSRRAIRSRLAAQRQLRAGEGPPDFSALDTWKS